MWKALAIALALSDMPLNPAVTQDTIRDTICVMGWTRTVRPPVAYTNAIKKRLFDEYGLPRSLMADFQLDISSRWGLAGLRLTQGTSSSRTRTKQSGKTM